MSLPVDLLPVQKSHIDLSDGALPSDFGIEDYIMCKLYDDVVLLEFADLESEDGAQYVKRGSILIKASETQNMWRKGRVILRGPRVTQTQIGDIVVFPNNMGIPITNLEVEGHGKIKNGVFLNEQRMFGVCKLKDA
jgi:hypothetical protein